MRISVKGKFRIVILIIWRYKYDENIGVRYHIYTYHICVLYVYISYTYIMKEFVLYGGWKRYLLSVPETIYGLKRNEIFLLFKSSRFEQRLFLWPIESYPGGSRGTRLDADLRAFLQPGTTTRYIFNTNLSFLLSLLIPLILSKYQVIFIRYHKIRTF